LLNDQSGSDLGDSTVFSWAGCHNHQHQDRPPEPEHVTPTQTRGLLTRARIRAPFDGDIISPKKTRHSNTIDNVKAKIDNVKAKIQDKERRSWSRPTLARRPVFGQLAASPTSFPLEEPPRQVYATTSLCLEKPPPRTRSPAPTGAWAQTHGTSIATDARGGTNLHVMQEQQLAAMQAACPDNSLNVGLTDCAAITSPSSPLCHTQNSARGTQGPSTTRTSLDLGSGVAG
jgi:hypothetical protein